MSTLELEPIDWKQMFFLFGPMGGIHAIIANIILDALQEEEIWELWLSFYQCTFQQSEASRT